MCVWRRGINKIVYQKKKNKKKHKKKDMVCKRMEPHINNNATKKGAKNIAFKKMKKKKVAMGWTLFLKKAGKSQKSKKDQR